MATQNTSEKQTHRDYTIRACKLKGLELVPPTRHDKTILIFDWSGGYGRCMVEATSWADARTKLNAAFQEQA